MIKQTIGMYFEPYFAEMNSKIAQIEADLDKLKAEKNKCVWKKIANAGSMWRSGCGCSEYIDGSPIALDWSYCHYCGKEIEEAGL